MSAAAPQLPPSSFAAPRPASTAVEDLFLTRALEFAFHRTRTRFELARSVFSSAAVDPGSALLLRHLQSLPLGDVTTVLDVGCGHGTLGIVLKALDDRRQVTFIDRDALACRFTARNLRLNDLDGGCDVIGSLGYDGLAAADGGGRRESSDLDPGGRPANRRFDLVVSNLPGKVGDAVMAELVEGAARIAGPGALLGFVVVEPLADRLRQLVASAGFEPLLDKGNKTHKVVIVEVSQRPPAVVPPGGFERGCYDRDHRSFSSAELSWAARTVVGLDEFDTLAQSTKLLRQALQGVRSTPATIVNPGQGHRAVIAALAGYRPEVLISRDLLALQASARCLSDAGIGRAPRLVHDVTGAGFYRRAGLMILHADDKAHAPWLRAEVERMLDDDDPPGSSAARSAPMVTAGPDADRSVTGEQPAQRHLVLCGRSGPLGRLEADLLSRRGRLAYKKSVKGHRVLRYVV